MEHCTTVRLVSDFWDYYDHWFDGYAAELVFYRLSSSGMTRREMLEYLQSLGFRVPIFGRTSDIHDRLRKKHRFTGFDHILDVVVYLDDSAHRGEGKIKIPLRDAIEKYPYHLATEYIPALPSGLGLSWRYLQLGDKAFWLEYASRNDWRSNYGDVSIKVLSRERDGYCARIKYPLFAVDFVPAYGLGLFAVDFNIAPQVRGTGVEELLSARDAAEAIKKAIYLICQNGEVHEHGFQICGPNIGR